MLQASLRRLNLPGRQASPRRLHFRESLYRSPDVARKPDLRQDTPRCSRALETAKPPKSACEHDARWHGGMRPRTPIRCAMYDKRKHESPGGHPGRTSPQTEVLPASRHAGRTLWRVNARLATKRESIKISGLFPGHRTRACTAEAYCGGRARSTGIFPIAA